MYDQNKRHRAVIHYTYFLRSIRKVAKIYDVGKSTLSRWLRHSGARPLVRDSRAACREIRGV